MLSYSIHFLLHLIGEAGLARSVGLGLGETSGPIAADRENSKVRKNGCQKGVKELSLFRQRLAGCPTSGPTVTTAGCCEHKGKRNSGVSSSTSRSQTEKSPRRCSRSTSASVLPGDAENCQEFVKTISHLERSQAMDFRSSRRKIFPDAVLGTASTKRTSRGCL